MSILDQVVNKVKSVEPGAGGLTGQFIELLQSSEFGGLQGLVQKFESAGLGSTIKSWIGGGKPLPITPAEITRVFGNDVISKLANKTGLPADQLVGKLTSILPETIGQLTPGGKLPSPEAIGELGGKLKEKIGI